VSRDELLKAVQALLDLDHRDQAQRAAAQLPEHLPVADLLRAADGAQQLARELAALRRAAPSAADQPAQYDPHDIPSHYS
jgi:hypothetical protein